jgi:hypothetical protein
MSKYPMFERRLPTIEEKYGLVQPPVEESQPVPMEESPAVQQPMNPWSQLLRDTDPDVVQ